MKWKELPFSCRVYLVSLNIVAIPMAVLCFAKGGTYIWSWYLLTVASCFVGTVNLSLPQLPSVVISMGDVFTVLALLEFGSGPALITYWANVLITALVENVRQAGWRSIRKLPLYRLVFNISCCSICIYAMEAVYRWARTIGGATENSVIAIASIALTWFLINTIALSFAISQASARTFFSVWKQGLGLYLLNFFGSSATAGLISKFYDRTSVSILLLSLPLAVVLYQLYSSYIQKYQQAKTHISELNALYLQTIEALASAVDAKDRYTHGHIRRVQAYAKELAFRIGITDEKELLALQAGALLHDIGKIAIPEYILNKPTVLTETEYEKMKIHPVVGASMLSTIHFPYPVVPIVKSHHERWDGNGYPEGLKAEEIPLTARVIALVDCYDALTTNRPYRSPMDRDKVIEFFRREAGRAYDPNVVQVFIDNIGSMEAAGNAVVLASPDVWGIKEPEKIAATYLRPLEKVQAVITYGKALNAAEDVQWELYSLFEFARADFRCLSPEEIFSFVGHRLSRLVRFDAAVFYAADLTSGVITAIHSIGEDIHFFDGISLPLEQKLSGWVAANNQSLCNLPPFPDFLGISGSKPSFQMSAIAPLNRNNQVLGAVSLYRKSVEKFTEDEFRRLEIVASQTAILLMKCANQPTKVDALLDDLTGLPNGFQLHLMFDNVATDAMRYEYPVSVFCIYLEGIGRIRKTWGPPTGDEALRAAAKYLRSELRETDLLVRYAPDEFITMNPKMSREQAENLKSRLQNELDHFNFIARPGVKTPLRASIGIALFPDDGTDVETLRSVAVLRASEDGDLRIAVRHRVRQLPHQ